MLHRVALATAGAALLPYAPVASAGSPSPGDAAPPTVELTAFADVAAPVDLAWRSGDAGLYFVTQTGTVTRIEGDTSKVVLDVSAELSTGGERGLLGLAFHPDGALAYINYTDVNGHTNVEEYSVAGDGTFEVDSRRTVLVVEQPYANHNGGDLAFGPDRLLYIGMGDGGSGGDPERRAQDLGELLGKLLRIDPTTPSGELGYTIPAGNPFVDVDGARGEIWSVGVRNPWRFSFDAETGDLWIADVGQSAFEEIDWAPATNGLDAGRGSNFGWSGYEASQPFNADVVVENPVAPVAEYTHADGRCSVSGGVRAGSDTPLAGWYLFSDYCTGELMGISITGTGATASVNPEIAVLATLGEPIAAVTAGPDGAIYALSLAGHVLRVDAGA